jgi:hypothetical protein
MSVIIIWKEGFGGSNETHAENCQDVAKKLNKGFTVEGTYSTVKEGALSFFSDFVPDEMSEEEALEQINAFPCAN